MKKFLLGTVGLIALGMASAPASAADLAARPVYTKAPPMVQAVYDWSGFYIGINGGWAQTNDHRYDPVFGLIGDLNPDGGTVGGQVGYRWQSGPWVFGLEAQGNWADLSGSTVNLLGLPGDAVRSKMDAFGLFTGQVGYAWNNALLYVKGGAAVANQRFDIFDTLGGFAQAERTRWGGVVGVGLEYGFAPNWTAGIEYDYIFRQSDDTVFSTPRFAPAITTVTTHTSTDISMITGRISYKFGGYGAPVAARY